MTELSQAVIAVTGTTVPAYDAIREPLARVVAAHGKGGAALAIIRGGEQIVDIAAGDYEVGDRQLVFSVGKFATAIAAQKASSSMLDLDAPVSDFWPAFRRASTKSITTRMVLSHRSGLVAIRETLTLEQLLLGRGDEAIERAEPAWEPDTAHGYHAFTFGLLMDGVFRRTVGVGVGPFLWANISEPLGIDVVIGAHPLDVPTIRPVRVRRTVPTDPGLQPPITQTGDTAIAALTADPASINRPDVLASAWPAAICIASAAGLARLGATTLDAPGAHYLLTAAQRADLVRPQSRGLDRVLGFPTAFGSGVQLPFPLFPMLGDECWGHEAAGGSFVVVDAVHDLSIGFTTDTYPAVPGASPAGLALLPAIRLLSESDS